MACCLTADEKEARAKNALIEKDLRRARLVLSREINLLLLGTGESGKSTVVKQMKIIHGDGFSTEERQEFVKLIHQNLCIGMSSILNAMPSLGISLADPANKAKAAEFLAAVSKMSDKAPLELIKKLWNDGGVQDAFGRRNEYQISDSTEYYMARLGVIEQADYLPDDQDVLRARVPTTGIIEYTFRVAKTTFRMVDVGGQRSQRRKWIHCFEDVTSLIFIVALSEYDQTLMEAQQTNRMAEAISLFRHITREKWFRSTAVILFLNKIDLLAEKLPRSDVRKYFPEFAGDQESLEEVENFFLDLFKKMKEHLYPHFTCATDTGNIKFVFESVRDMILSHHLQEFHIA